MTCDSGRLRNGGDAKLAPCAASQSGNRPNSATQVIEHLLTKPSDNVAWLERAGRRLREMEEEERAIAASSTVAGAPPGLSPCRSQAKPLIDYRKGGAE